MVMQNYQLVKAVRSIFEKDMRHDILIQNIDGQHWTLLSCFGLYTAVYG